MYFDLLALIGYVVIIAIVPLALYLGGLIMGEPKSSQDRDASFECGQVPVGKAHSSLSVKYIPYALIYGVFTAFALILLIAGPGLIDFELKTKQAGLVGIPLIVIIISSVASISASMALRQFRRR